MVSPRSTSIESIRGGLAAAAEELVGLVVKSFLPWRSPLVMIGEGIGAGVLSDPEFRQVYP
jgi:hypothetical protein